MADNSERNWTIAGLILAAAGAAIKAYFDSKK